MLTVSVAVLPLFFALLLVQSISTVAILLSSSLVLHQNSNVVALFVAFMFLVVSVSVSVSVLVDDDDLCARSEKVIPH